MMSLSTNMFWKWVAHTAILHVYTTRNVLHKQALKTGICSFSLLAFLLKWNTVYIMQTTFTTFSALDVLSLVR